MKDLKKQAEGFKSNPGTSKSTSDNIKHRERARAIESKISVHDEATRTALVQHHSSARATTVLQPPRRLFLLPLVGSLHFEGLRWFKGGPPDSHCS